MKVNAGQASSTLIPEYIGSDFDKVITVADNIETVTEVVDNLTHIKAADDNLGIINTVSSNIDAVVSTSSNIKDVKSVATNIDPIKVVESNLEKIVTVANTVTDVGNVSANIGYVKNVAEGIEGLPVISYIGKQPPDQPSNGAEWYCTTDGRSYVWYVDNDSGQWVESSPQSDSSKGQHYFGNWNPNDQKYPVSEHYSGLWDVVLNPGQSSVQFDNKTWVTGNKLSYYTDTGIYTQIQTFSEVASVNGHKGAVVLSAADISADAAGTADSAVSHHEAKQSAHQISGISGLQAALDFKYSPTNKPSAADIGADASGAAESAVLAHEAKAGAHNINGVLGLQDVLNEKYSPDNKPTAVDVGALASNGTAVAATKLATPRTLTIGNTGKVFDGTENVNWSAAEICVALAAACVPISTNVPDVGSIAHIRRFTPAQSTAPEIDYGSTVAGSTFSLGAGAGRPKCTGTWKVLSYFSAVAKNSYDTNQDGLAIRIA